MKYNQFLRYLYSGFLLLITSFGLTAQVTADQEIDGGVWKIIYHADTKTVDYVCQSKLILAGVFVQAKQDSVLLKSNAYSTVNISDTAITDVFGQGKKCVIEYSMPGKSSLKQIFYFYPGRNYFLTEVLLVSERATSSNYLAPVVTTTRSSFLTAATSNRMLKIPFDNDAWVRYSSNPLTSAMTSYEVTSVFSGTIRNGLVIGSVEHDIWKTGVVLTTSGNEMIDKLECYGGIADELTRDKQTATTMEHGSVYGTTIKSPKIFVGYFDDWRVGMETFGEANAVITPARVWNNGTPFGWNSWGEMKADINYDGVMDVSDFIKTDLMPNGFSNNGTVYVDLDSFWDKMTDVQLKAFADHCIANGQTPGIYWGPFADWGNWGDRTVEGSSYKYKDAYLYANGVARMLDGATCMDPTHPATKARMRYFLNRFRTAGFKYIKLDFVTNGSLESDSHYDAHVTTGIQAYNAGMKYLMEQACGTDMYMALSIAPAFPAQYAHSRRISCDAWGAIGDSEYVLNALSFGWWLDRVYSYNDADHLVLYNNSIGENRVRITSGVITGIYMLGDNFSQKGTHIGSLVAREKAKTYATNTDINDIARMGKSFRPVEGYLASGVSNAENFFMHETDQYIYFVVFNYSTASKIGQLDVSRLGINPVNVGTVKELWNQTTSVLNAGKLLYAVPAKDVRVYRIEKISSAVETVKADAHQLKTVWNLNKSLLSVQSPVAFNRLQVTSMQGQIQVQKNPLPTENYDADFSKVAKGIYVVSVDTLAGERLVAKIIK